MRLARSLPGYRNLQLERLHRRTGIGCTATAVVGDDIVVIDRVGEDDDATAVRRGQRIPLAGVAHQIGTVKFGKDPKTSVLDANCKVHDIDNLYVVDGSFFCSSAAVNPALTIIANALRVGDHLVGRLK